MIDPRIRAANVIARALLDYAQPGHLPWHVRYAAANAALDHVDEHLAAPMRDAAAASFRHGGPVPAASLATVGEDAGCGVDPECFKPVHGGIVAPGTLLNTREGIETHVQPIPADRSAWLGSEEATANAGLHFAASFPETYRWLTRAITRLLGDRRA